MDSRSSSRSTVRFADFELNPATGELSSSGRKTSLQDKPLQVLLTLLERPGGLVTREELIERLWDSQTFVDFDQSLNKAVNRLREALRDSGTTPRLIETLPRRGYRFIGVVPAEPKGSSSDEDGVVHTSTAKTMAIGSALSSQQAIYPIPVSGSSQRTADKKLALRIAAVVVVVLIAPIVGIFVSGRLRHYSASPLSIEITELTRDSHVGCIALSPDGRYLAYEYIDGGISSGHLRQTANRGDAEIIKPENGAFNGLTFTPDGNDLYFVRADKNDPGFKYLYVVPTMGGAPEKIVSDIDSPVSFSPDGSRFVYTRGIPTRNATEIRTAKVDGGDDRLLFTAENTFADYQPGATWSPDGNNILVSLTQNQPKRKFVLFSISTINGTAQEFLSRGEWIGRAVWTSTGHSFVVAMGEAPDARGQLWAISYPGGEQHKLTSGLTNYGPELSLTRDGLVAASTVLKFSSNLWIVDTVKLDEPRQITREGPSILRVMQSSGGDLLGLTQDQELLSFRPDGSNRELFTGLPVSDFAWCGHFAVIRTTRDGVASLVRLNSHGSEPQTLVSGLVFGATCAPDGNFVYYADLRSPQRIMYLDMVNGGEPKQLIQIPDDGIFTRLNITGDGHYLAVPFEKFHPDPSLNVAIVATGSGETKQFVRLPSEVYLLPSISWAPNEQSIQFLVDQHGKSNIWEQPLVGGPPRQVTHFTSGKMFDFRWAPDGKKLFLERGNATRDAVLVRNFASD